MKKYIDAEFVNPSERMSSYELWYWHRKLCENYPDCDKCPLRYLTCFVQMCIDDRKHFEYIIKTIEEYRDKETNK